MTERKDYSCEGARDRGVARREPDLHRAHQKVTIDDDTEVLPEAQITQITRGTTAATFEFPPMRDGTPHVPVQ